MNFFIKINKEQTLGKEFFLLSRMPAFRKSCFFTGNVAL